MKKILISIAFVFLVLHASGQDTAYVRKQISLLSSEKYHGRGYVSKGVNKAARHLAEEMKSIGLQSFDDNYFQQLSFPINSFPRNIDVEIDGKKMKAGEDFLIDPACPAVNKEYDIVVFDSISLSDTLRFITKAALMNVSDKMVVIDFSFLESSDVRWFYIHLMRFNYLKAAGYIELSDKHQAWAARTYQSEIPGIKMKKQAFNQNASKIKITAKPKFIKEFSTENVIGYIPGSSDEYVVFCAHYDHLGRMGKNVYIPGANDNASGTATVLDLARYYKKNPSKYNMVFMLFTGEEAGLFGSLHYANNPYFPLEKIKFVINFDMVGTGEKGAAIVNGQAEGYEKIAETFQAINVHNEYFTDLKLRGESKNSDHYPFHAKGVKAVFFYTMGADTFYHSPKDVVSNLTLTGYIPLFKLVTDFVSQYE